MKHVNAGASPEGGVQAPGGSSSSDSVSEMGITTGLWLEEKGREGVREGARKARTFGAASGRFAMRPASAKCQLIWM